MCGDLFWFSTKRLLDKRGVVARCVGLVGVFLGKFLEPVL